MPQSGDGDLWPTTDDDTSSARAKDAETHELPVPDQQEQPEEPAAAESDAADEPDSAPETDAPEGRDEPHAKPEQQITQPVSWPVADLERQAASEDPVRSFSRPLPKSPDTKTAIVKRPAWPPTGEEKKPDEAAGTPAEQPSKKSDGSPTREVNVTWPKGEAPRRDNAASSEPAKPQRDDSAPGDRRDNAAPGEPAKSRRDDTASGEPEKPRRDDTASGESEKARRDHAASGEPARPRHDDNVSGESARPRRDDSASGEPRRDNAAPGEPEKARRDHTASGEPARPRRDDTASGEPRRDYAASSEPAKPRWDNAASAESAKSRRDDTASGEPRRDYAASSEPARPRRDNTASGEKPRQEDAPTSFVRPVSPPPSFLRPDNNKETSFVRRQEPPSFVRPDNSTTTFIRRDKSFTDSATVNLSRPERPERQEPERRTEWPPPEPPRAAPQRVGPQPESAEPEQEKKPRKTLLIAAISVAAVIAIAAGVVFGVPGLSDKLGLTGEDPVAIDPPPAPISYSPALHGPDTAATGPTSQGVAQVLTGPMASPALGNVNGIVIDPATGETLYEKSPDTAITPASTGKILTAAAALLTLDPTEQLVTKVVEGDQPGEVIIVGGGDPTISSLPVGEESIYPGAAHLSELVDQVKASGAQVQTVYIDQSRYAEPGLADSWLRADIGAGYIAPIVPAMLDGDRQGDPTENYVARTTDPGRTLVDAFADRIGASPAGEIEKKAPENAKVLGEIRSAPITQLVDNMLNRSENTLGDVLAHEVAIKAGEEPNFDGASKAMLDVLRENGFDVDGVQLRDGSGMSEENKMTARLLAEVLAVAASPDGKDPRTAKLRPLLGGLPVAGGSGTLADRYTEADALAGKGWVRAKTGSLTGINSLAGIVLDKDNRPLVFAFLTSGTVATSARPALDSVTAALRGCGCQ